MTIIAIEGVDGVGKTTLCDQLKSYFGNNCCVIVSSPSKTLPIGKLIRKEFHDREGMFSPLSNSGKFLLEDYLHKAAILENCFLINQLSETYPLILLDRWIYSFYAYARTEEFDYVDHNFFAHSPFYWLSEVPVIYIDPPSKKVLKERMMQRDNPTIDDLAFDKIFQRHGKFLKVIDYLVPNHHIRVSTPLVQKELKDVLRFINQNEQ